MAGQRPLGGPHSRASWLPRLAGIGVAVLLAGGVTGYLVSSHHSRASSQPPLPTKVLSYQTVGLVATGPAVNSGELLQLLGPGSSGGPQLEFSLLSATEQAEGSGQWAADQMSSDTYIFIYLPTHSCLSVIGPQGQPRLVLQHCNLSAAQRWRRTGAAIVSAQGHSFYQYANLGNGACLTQDNELTSQAWGAGAQTCLPLADKPATQLIAFWWGTV